MAGRPKRAQLVKAVTDAGGEDALIERIEGGETIASIAESLGTSRPMLSSFLNRTSSTAERIRHARETSADSLVEATLAIADSATHENDRAKRLQISTRQWLASKFNRQAYGEQSEAQQPLDVGNLYLQVLELTNAPQLHQADGPTPGPDGTKPRAIEIKAIDEGD